MCQGARRPQIMALPVIAVDIGPVARNFSNSLRQATKGIAANMLDTGNFDADTAAMLRELCDSVCAQFVSLALDEQKMREVIATAIIGMATNGQRNPNRIRRYARFKAAEQLILPL
jgi:hypothetical protein